MWTNKWSSKENIKLNRTCLLDTFIWIWVTIWAAMEGSGKMEMDKGKHSKIKIKQFDQIFDHIGGIGLFQIVYAVLIGKSL